MAGAVIGLLAVMAWRIREARGAVSVKKIVIPPMGMATGFSMFLAPSFRIPWAWAGIAFAVGAVVLAYPLLVTFLQTGLVPRLPTAVLATGIALLGFLSLGCGIVLDSVSRGRHEMKRLRYLEIPAPDFA